MHHLCRLLVLLVFTSLGEGWKPWDYAAGSLIVTEAGGCVSDVGCVKGLSGGEEGIGGLSVEGPFDDASSVSSYRLNEGGLPAWYRLFGVKNLTLPVKSGNKERINSAKPILSRYRGLPPFNIMGESVLAAASLPLLMEVAEILSKF